MSGNCYLLKSWVKRTGYADGLAAQAALFFILSLTTAVFAIGSDASLLMKIMPGLVWVLILLSSLLGLSDLLARDAQDGLLDDMVLSRQSLPMLMAIKGIAHWAATGLPLSIIAPSVVYAMDENRTIDPLFMFQTLVLGSLYFSGLGLMASALVLQARRSFALYAVIVMPLAIPALIFGSGALTAQALGMNEQMPFYLLAACTVLICTLSPFAAAWIVRMKVKS